MGSILLIFLVFLLHYYVSLSFKYRFVVSVTISALERCPVRLYRQFFCGKAHVLFILFAFVCLICVAFVSAAALCPENVYWCNMVMVFNATLTNRSVIYPGGRYFKEKTTDLSQVIDKLKYMLHRVHLAWAGFKLTTLGCKSNYYTITITTGPSMSMKLPVVIAMTRCTVVGSFCQQLMFDVLFLMSIPCSVERNVLRVEIVR